MEEDGFEAALLAASLSATARRGARIFGEDIELLLMHNGKYAAELANNLSAKTRKAPTGCGGAQTRVQTRSSAGRCSFIPLIGTK